MQTRRTYQLTFLSIRKLKFSAVNTTVIDNSTNKVIIVI
jgi:hypothetical protein